jgi:hypothetical protein
MKDSIVTFLSHTALKFELEVLDGKTSYAQRDKWMLQHAKKFKFGTDISQEVKEICKTIRQYSKNSSWVFDQWFQTLLGYRPNPNCHPLSEEMIMKFVDWEEIDDEEFMERRRPLMKALPKVSAPDPLLAIA